MFVFHHRFCFESNTHKLVRHSCEEHCMKNLIEHELELLGLHENMWTQHYLIYKY